MKSKWRENFFLYFDLHRPTIEQGGVIEIEDFD